MTEVWNANKKHVQLSNNLDLKKIISAILGQVHLTETDKIQSFRI